MLDFQIMLPLSSAYEGRAHAQTSIQALYAHHKKLEEPEPYTASGF